MNDFASDAIECDGILCRKAAAILKSKLPDLRKSAQDLAIFSHSEFEKWMEDPYKRVMDEQWMVFKKADALADAAGDSIFRVLEMMIYLRSKHPELCKICQNHQTKESQTISKQSFKKSSSKAQLLQMLMSRANMLANSNQLRISVCP
jgi:hypothetical protein